MSGSWRDGESAMERYAETTSPALIR